LKKIKSNKSAAQPKLQCEYVIIKNTSYFPYIVSKPNGTEGDYSCWEHTNQTEGLYISSGMCA